MDPRPMPTKTENDINGNEKVDKYIEQYLQKKEGERKDCLSSIGSCKNMYNSINQLACKAFREWIEYWVIVRGKYMLFYSHRCDISELREAFRGFVELTSGTKCLVTKRKKYSFPFYVATDKGKFYFKCQSLLLRHQWIHAIELACQGKPPKELPLELPPRSHPANPPLFHADKDYADKTKKNADKTQTIDSTESSVSSSENPDEVSGSALNTDEPQNLIFVTPHTLATVHRTNFLGETSSSKCLDTKQQKDKSEQRTNFLIESTDSRNSDRQNQKSNNEQCTNIVNKGSENTTDLRSTNGSGISRSLEGNRQKSSASSSQDIGSNDGQIVVEQVLVHNRSPRYTSPPLRTASRCSILSGDSRTESLLGSLSPVQSTSGPSWRSSSSRYSRPVRSAELPRGSPSAFIIDQNSRSSLFMAKGSTSSSLAVNTRFSRHLGSSAPDLQLLTVEDL